MNFTTVVAVDGNTLAQLEISAPTWRKNRPELWNNKMLVIYDRDVVTPDALDFLDHPFLDLYGWPPDFLFTDQREKMLSAFVHVPPAVVTTTWWLKIDCDAVALNSDPWLDPSWFEAQDTDGTLTKYNSFIGSRWGYTKPSEQMSLLDLWADGISGLNAYPPLDLPYNPESKTLKHRRMASWICFFNTAWSKIASGYASYPAIPVPSEVGYHFYIAERRSDPYMLTNFKKRGWGNFSNLRKLRHVAKGVL